MKRTLSAILLTAAAGVAYADGSGTADQGTDRAAPAPKKLNTEEAPVPTTPLIIAGVALAAFAVVLLVGRRKKRNQASAPQKLAGDLAEVRLVIETDESATVTAPGIRAVTDRLGEAVLQLPIGNHEVTIEVGAETFKRTINVPAIKRMRIPINLTKERISRGVSQDMPVVAPRAHSTSKPPTSMARAYPDPASQGQLGKQLAGLIDVELEQPKPVPPTRTSTTKAPLNLDFSSLGSQVTPPAPVVEPIAAPAPSLELDDLDLQLPADAPPVPAAAVQLPPSPSRQSPLHGAPASAPEVRSSPLRDVVTPPRAKQVTTQPSAEMRPPAPPERPALGSTTTPKLSKAERQQQASAITDFALDELGPAPTKKRAETFGPIPDLDLAPPTQAPQAPVEPSSNLNIGEFALSDFGMPAASTPEIELPKVTAASVADLTIDDDLAVPRSPAPRREVPRPTPSIGDFELTPNPGAPPVPTRTTRASVGPMSAIGNRYRKTGGAGAGPLGALHRGRDENAERDVYIEELPLSITLAVPPAVLTRLEHPNILKLYEHVVDSTKNYLITELVEGKSLEQMLSERGGALSSFEAIAIMDQICAGLAYAHQHGVFHRNIRPACIWISGRTAKLTSFGITLGRPTPYQAPELATGGQPDVRSDLYSVGITLVQLLTGAAPGGNVDLPTDLPRSLGGMIRKMISREPMIRPTNIKLVRDAMASVL